jgi:hypothetical protein
MALANLIERIESKLDSRDPSKVLAVAMIALSDPACTTTRWEDIDLRNAELKFLSFIEQYSAVAGELESLASQTPSEFDPQHIWTMIRAIKVQSKLIDLFFANETAGVVRDRKEQLS